MSSFLNPRLNSIFNNQTTLTEEEEPTSSSVVGALEKALADTYLLYLKTQNFHWNVTGPTFKLLHEMFGSQYDDLAEAVDLLAEQIRILGSFSPGSFSQFSELSSIEEETDILSSEKMIAQLINDNEIVIESLKELISVSNSNNDDATADIGIERIRVHSKAIWFLKSSL